MDILLLLRATRHQGGEEQPSYLLELYSPFLFRMSKAGEEGERTLRQREMQAALMNDNEAPAMNLSGWAKILGTMILLWFSRGTTRGIIIQDNNIKSFNFIITTYYLFFFFSTVVALVYVKN